MSLFESASLVVTPNGVKASKLYSVKPADGSGDMTVVRATTATRVNSSGLIESVAANIPRLDYTNSTCPSILIEPQITNLALRSEEFDNASWVKLNLSSTSNSTISPSGVTNADSLIENTTNGLHITYQTITTTATTYSYSCYIKPDTRTRAYLRTDISLGTVRTLFDLTGAGSVITLAHTSATITNIGNGWYRCSVKFTEGTGAGRLFGIEAAVGTSISYTGNGLNAFYLWGAQLEAGANATSYIPTTTASVTRNTDLISKTEVADLIGQTEGTLYAEVNMKNWESATRIFNISDGSSSNRIGIILSTSKRFRGLVSNSVTLVADVISGSYTDGIHKIALAYKQNNVVFYVDGVLIGSDTSVSIPTCSSVYLGKVENIGTTGIFNDSIKSAALWKERLTNAELATLTTL